MSDEVDLNISELRRKRTQDNGHSRSGYQSQEQFDPRNQQYRPGSARVIDVDAPYSNGPRRFEPGPAPFNLWRLIEILFRRWTWLFLGCVVAGVCAFLLGLKVTSFSARVSLIRKVNPNAFTAVGGENTTPQAYLSQELTAQTLWLMMRSPEVFRRVAEKASPPVAPSQLAKAVRVIPERDPDFVTLAVSGKQPKEVLAKWANVYADEVVNYTKELQQEEAGSINEFLKAKLARIDEQLLAVNNDLIRFSEQAHTLDVDKEVEAYTAQLVALEYKAETARLDLETIDLKVRNFEVALKGQPQGNDQLQVAEADLERLRMRGYTDLWPEVAAQKALVEKLRKQGASGTNDLAGSRMPGGSLANAIQLQILELKSTKEVRERELLKYQEQEKRMRDKAKGLSQTAVTYAQHKARQRRLEDLHTTLVSKQQEAQLLHENALGYFKVFSYASPSDVGGRKRLFAVGLLAIVGGLLGLLTTGGLALIAEAMKSRIKTASDLERVTRLPVLATLGDLRKMSPEQQINWAFRTLTLLQGKLNNSSDQTLVCGFISSKHGEGRSTWINLLVSAASQRGMRVLTVATRPSTAREDEFPENLPKDPGLLPVGPATTLTKNVLAFPAQVTEQFNDPQAQPIVHIPLPGWVWNLERRKQWRTALDHWEGIENLVLLVELPPACQPESVLLAEHLPQVIWLTSSGVADIEETRAQLETLRHARCNLVGAVLNREPSSFVRKHFSTWFGRFGLLLACGFLVARASEPVGPAASPEPVVGTTNLAFSIIGPGHRAPWQQRLTLGPGDALDISVFRHPELARTNLVVGLDGKLSYLQIQDFPVTGLTIDELRAKLDAQLEPYFVGGARTVIVPVSFNSKKYYMLGKVVTEGVFALDRPLTLIEAVARAKGLQTQTVGQDTVEMADFAHSFLVRQGKRVPVDLERLFRQGDLSQNVAIEPNDYVYFAPGGEGDIFVLGEVLVPGRVMASPDASVIAAISVRGGFTPNAYRRRVLVVRGSLQKPEAYAVDAPAILAGRIPDFRLEPKDIVYVSARPWLRVEQLLDIAAQAFIESAVTFWVGENVPAVFTSPVLPKP